MHNQKHDDFFNATNQQITRITSTQVSNLTANVSQLEKSPKLNGKNLTLTDVCSVAPHVADKMSQSKAKDDQESIPGFRLPSTVYKYRPIKVSMFSKPIRLNDVLPKNDDSNETDRDKHTSTVMSERRPCTAASSLLKISAHFDKQQRQNTSYKSSPDQAKRTVNVPSVDNTEDLNKTVKETLLVCSMPLRIHSSNVSINRKTK